MGMRLWQRFTALLCISAFLCSASGLLPALTMFVGQLDDDHHVLVGSSGERLQIRFHHTHHANPTAKAARAVMLDDSRLDSPADHVIEFASAGDSVLQLPSLAVLDYSFLPIGMVGLDRWVPISRSRVAILYARPPPGEATWSRCLRSVVLLV